MGRRMGQVSDLVSGAVAGQTRFYTFYATSLAPSLSIEDLLCDFRGSSTWSLLQARREQEMLTHGVVQVHRTLL